MLLCVLKMNLPIFTAALFMGAKTWKQLKCSSIDEWIDKRSHTYTMEHCSAIRKDEMVPFAATWMDLEIIMVSEITQTGEVKNHTTSLLCGI